MAAALWRAQVQVPQAVECQQRAGGVEDPPPMPPAPERALEDTDVGARVQPVACLQGPRSAQRQIVGRAAGPRSSR